MQQQPQQQTRTNVDRLQADYRSSWEYAMSRTQAMARQRDGGSHWQPPHSQSAAGHTRPGQQHFAIEAASDSLPYAHGWGPRTGWREVAAAPPEAGGVEWTPSTSLKWQPMHQTALAGQPQLPRQPPPPAGAARNHAHLARSLSLVSLRAPGGGGGAGGAGAPSAAAATFATVGSGAHGPRGGGGGGGGQPGQAFRARSASLGRKGKKGPEKTTWDIIQVFLQRVPRFGFGIAVAGGRDAPHFASGDPSIVVSDVIKGGPAEGKLRINDRVLSVNGVSLENVEHARAIAILKESGNAVNLVIRRRAIDRQLPTEAGASEYAAAASAAGHSSIPSAAATAAALGKVTLIKKGRRDEFGVVFGFKLYVKQLTPGSLAARSGLINEGDVVLKINNVSTDTLSLAEAAKMIEKASSRGVGEKLSFHLKREPDPTAVDEPGAASAAVAPAAIRRSLSLSSLHKPPQACDDGTNATRRIIDLAAGGFGDSAYSPNDFSATVAYQKPDIEKAGLQGYSVLAQPESVGRSFDIRPAAGQSLSRPDLSGKYVGVPNGNSWNGGGRADDHRQPAYTNAASNVELQHQVKSNLAPRQSASLLASAPENRIDGRRVVYKKEGSGPCVGLAGGNATGTFISVVLDGSTADAQGLQEGDQIIEINGCPTHGMTREEVYTTMTSCKEFIDITVRQAPTTSEYERVVAAGGAGDLFYVRAHFKYSGGAKHMAFQPGDLLRVTDTLVGGEPGEWTAEKLDIAGVGGGSGGNVRAVASGLVPNARRAAELAAARDNSLDDDDEEFFGIGSKPSPTTAEGTGSRASLGNLFKRRASPAPSKEKQHSSKNHFEDVILGDTSERFQAYEQVALQKPGFARPLVLYGCLADIARDLLCDQLPDTFERPQATASGAIHLSAVHDSMSRGRHCVLLAGPAGLRRLARAHYAPVVVLLRAESRAIARELRERYTGRMPPRKLAAMDLYERGMEMEESAAAGAGTTGAGRMLSAVVHVSTRDSERDWLDRLCATVASLQRDEPVWLPMTRRPNASCSGDGSWEGSRQPEANPSSIGTNENGANGERSNFMAPSGAAAAIHAGAAPSTRTVGPTRGTNGGWLPAATAIGSTDRERPGEGWRSAGTATTSASATSGINSGVVPGGGMGIAMGNWPASLQSQQPNGVQYGEDGYHSETTSGTEPRPPQRPPPPTAAALASVKTSLMSSGWAATGSEQPLAASGRHWTDGVQDPIAAGSTGGVSSDASGCRLGDYYRSKGSGQQANEANESMQQQADDVCIMRVPAGSLTFSKNSDYAVINKLRTRHQVPEPQGSHEYRDQRSQEESKANFASRGEPRSSIVNVGPVRREPSETAFGHSTDANNKAFRGATWTDSQASGARLSNEANYDVSEQHRYGSAPTFGYSLEQHESRVGDNRHGPSHNAALQSSRTSSRAEQSRINPDTFWLNQNSFDTGAEAGVLYHAVPLILTEGSSDSPSQHFDGQSSHDERMGGGAGDSRDVEQVTQITLGSNSAHGLSSNREDDYVERRPSQPFNSESAFKSSL